MRKRQNDEPLLAAQKTTPNWAKEGRIIDLFPARPTPLERAAQLAAAEHTNTQNDSPGAAGERKEPTPWRK